MKSINQLPIRIVDASFFLRIIALLGKIQVNTVANGENWYAEICRMLQERQQRDGSKLHFRP